MSLTWDIQVLGNRSLPAEAIFEALYSEEALICPSLIRLVSIPRATRQRSTGKEYTHFLKTQPNQPIIIALSHSHSKIKGWWPTSFDNVIFLNPILPFSATDIVFSLQVSITFIKNHVQQSNGTAKLFLCICHSHGRRLRLGEVLFLS